MDEVIRATEDDIRYAYRLLLGREPDEGGFAHHRRLLAHGTTRPDELARDFMASAEFAQCQRQEPIEVALDGFSVFVLPEDHGIGQGVRTHHEYEPHVTAALREMLAPGDTFVDVGANIGYFTQLAASIVGAHGDVIAIEPMDKNVQLIYRALEKNGFGHVRVHACAASDRVELVSVATGPGTSNGQVVAASHAGARLFTQTRCLDELTGDLDRIDLVKFDIEGYELRAWRGFRQGLKTHRPAVLTEFHPYCMRVHVGVDPAEYLDELFAYAGTVEVLAFTGARISCAAPADVTRQWKLADEAARGDGTCHLDLLIRP